MSVLSVSMSTTHSFSKSPCPSIYLLVGRGVKDDAHCSPAPTTSVREIHIIDSSLFSKLAAFNLTPGALGENITTQGLDLFALTEGTKLYFGAGDAAAAVKITGLRQPKKRLSEWPEGLLDKAQGMIGIYAVVEREGYVKVGEKVRVEPPPGEGRVLVGV